MRSTADYYEVLGVSRDASASDIKTAYRQLARKYHPDVNGGSADATERFKKISEAYAVLSDPQKRRRYDAGGLGDFAFDGGFSSFFDIFNQAFGFNMNGARSSPGRDREAHITIELEEVLIGSERTIDYERISLCETCDGSGAAPGSQPIPCSFCAGHGQVRQRRETLLGTMTTVITCPECKGTGRVVKDPCEDCAGRGVKSIAEQLEVHIPAGIRDGQHLELRGMGDVSLDGGPPGNLYVRISVTDHPTFTRHGDHLYMPLDVTISQAALGDMVTVKAIEGEHELTIPPGIQSGTELRIKGKGLPSLGSTRRGDQVVSVRVKTPTELTDRQLELLRELAIEDGVDITPPADSSIFERVKRLFGTR